MHGNMFIWFEFNKHSLASTDCQYIIYANACLDHTIHDNKFNRLLINYAMNDADYYIL